MKHAAGDILKYHEMEMSEPVRVLLITDHKAFAAFCNGVGSRVGIWKTLLWHLTPNSIWFLDITPASDIHDVEYSIPDRYHSMMEARAAWNTANRRFLRNMRRLIADAGGFFEGWRLNRAKLYFEAVSTESAFQSFLDGKRIG